MAEEKQLSVEEQVETLMTTFAEEKDALREFLTRIGKEHSITRYNNAVIDQQIAELDQVISAQVDEIIHNKEFQELESAWRGLQYLVENTKFDKPVKIEVLDTSKEELFEDLENAKSGNGYEKDSGFWHHVYWGAYDKIGGHPYTVMVSDYQFDQSQPDIKLLRHISILSEMAQMPFIGNVSPKFFGKDSFEDVMVDRNLETHIRDNPKYKIWHSFREDDRSKYIGLALPRFLGRSPYSQETERTKNFNYTENPIVIEKDESGKTKKRDRSLWVNASFAMATNMIRSFESAGWSVKIVGVDTGGKVDNLPMPFVTDSVGTETRIPVEASVGAAKDQELTDMGLIALAHWDRTDYACFFEARSVKRHRENLKDPIERANDLVSVGLQYNMLVTRIAHFLKYRQLRFVGRNAGKAEIQSSLEEWLNTLVADQPNPQDEVVARKPLRSYKLEVKEMEDRPGFFQIEAEFRPHIAITGFDIRLKLVAYHSE
ncbi:MAG: type VI secretion system contractile sheath large subunit [Calditrichaeota bacterium]|nr:MAG: type VI secretion system contractile sheath large subunit [Calditrichota bacterium]